MTLADLDGKSPAELEAIAAEYRQAAIDAEHLRVLKLQRDDVVSLPTRHPTPPQPRNDAFALAQMRSSTLSDPEKRIRDVVREVAHFTDDRELIVKTAVSWAEDCGIPRDAFVPIITAAVKNLPSRGRRNVS